MQWIMMAMLKTWVSRTSYFQVPNKTYYKSWQVNVTAINEVAIILIEEVRGKYDISRHHDNYLSINEIQLLAVSFDAST